MKRKQFGKLQFAKVRALTSTYDSYLRLEKHEIPRPETDLKTAIAKLSDANKGVDQVYPKTLLTQRTTAVSAIKLEIKSLEEMKQPVQEITRHILNLSLSHVQFLILGCCP